jgi:hypothetical protein
VSTPRASSQSWRDWGAKASAGDAIVISTGDLGFADPLSTLHARQTHIAKADFAGERAAIADALAE